METKENNNDIKDEKDEKDDNEENNNNNINNANNIKNNKDTNIIIVKNENKEIKKQKIEYIISLMNNTIYQRYFLI